MKSSAFTTYLILFFSGIFVVIIVYFAINILMIEIFKSNYLASKQSAKVLANILNSVFSSTANVTIMIVFPKTEGKIFFYEDNVTVIIGNDVYSEKIFKPTYIVLEVTPITLSKTVPISLVIEKINDKVSIST